MSDDVDLVVIDDAVRVSAHETRWLGTKCAEAIVWRTESERLDAIVLASSGEVERLLKSGRA